LKAKHLFFLLGIILAVFVWHWTSQVFHGAPNETLREGWALNAATPQASVSVAQKGAIIRHGNLPSHLGSQGKQRETDNYRHKNLETLASQPQDSARLRPFSCIFVLKNFSSSQQCIDQWGARNEGWYQILRAGFRTCVVFIKIAAGLGISFFFWYLTTQYLTKKVEFSKHLLVEKSGQSGKKKVKFVIRNRGLLPPNPSSGNSANRPPWWTRKQVSRGWIGKTASWFNVFDLQLHGRLKVKFSNCGQEKSLTDECPRRAKEMSFKLKIHEPYHAFIKSNSKRILDFDFDVDPKQPDLVAKIAANQCCCEFTSECRSEFSERVSRLEGLKKAKNISIHSVMNVFGDSATIELVAMVTGKTTLRKKPIRSREYTFEDFKGIGYFYSDAPYSEYETQPD
jgi:hypothetical protein